MDYTFYVPITKHIYVFWLQNEAYVRMLKNKYLIRLIQGEGNYMPYSEIDECIARLVTTPICPAEDASKYAKELQKLADKYADSAQAKKESRFFRALADENRIRILKLLMLREMCVCELKVALNMTQPTTSHHLGILENEGLIKKTKRGKWAYYSIANKKLLENMKKLGLLS